MKFVIENLEQEIYEWSLIEYEHISEIVGKGNLIFTNVPMKESKKLESLGAVCRETISELDFDRVCVLSQYAEKTLSAIDSEFECLVFGGILGDSPAKKRTNNIIESLKKSKKRFEQRNLGSIQMPTDNAVFAAKKILEGKKLGELKFIDEVEIEINENESVVLPFRYIIDGNKLVISEKLVEHLRNREEF